MSLRGHAGEVSAAAFSPDGRQIASAGTDGTVRLWDFTAPQEGPRLSGPPRRSFQRVAFGGDSQRLTAITPGLLLTWELTTSRKLFAQEFGLIWRGEYVTSVLSRDGRYLACGGTGGGKLAVYEAMTGKEVFAQRDDKLEWRELAFSPDGRLLADASEKGWVRVRDAQTGRILKSLEGHRVDTQSHRLAFSPDGSRLASASAAPQVKIWDTGGWQELHSLNGHSSNVLCLAFSHDSRYLASGGFDRKICVWDATTGTKMFDLPGHADYVSCVTFSPDNKRLFSCGSEGAINVWDVPNRVKLLTLHQRGHEVTISPDGRRLASSTRNGTVLQVWDSELLSREERWRRHQERIPFWVWQMQSAAKTEPTPR
jgi:WD40 repeat protein